jgi:hypothetical protein
MATAPDQSILEALRGNVVESTKQPTPRLVKIYISSTKQGEQREINSRDIERQEFWFMGECWEN